jgi:glyoxylase-like metal-dependent hydrolase (beta-lactamase superfamily II)
MSHFRAGAWVLLIAAAVVACPAATDSPSASSAGAVTKGDDLDENGSEGSEGSGDATGVGEAISCPSAQEAFDVVWPAGGPDCDREPVFAVHRYDQDTFILRQSLCTSFEGPFIFMLFGEDKVLVEDSGAGGVPVVEAVMQVVDQWRAENGKDFIEVVLVNSHAHGDHVAGNALFEAQPGVTVVGIGVQEVSRFFDIDWPQESAELDLGGRIVDVLPIPGHEDSHIALYDRREGLLLTGDTLYPGRLYIDDFPTYVQSIEKLFAFTEAHQVCWVLGAHIEMSRAPGVEFPSGSTHHPEEHVLQLTSEHLNELVKALRAMGDTARRETHEDFVIFPL